jgi:hypothetical protein
MGTVRAVSSTSRPESGHPYTVIFSLLSRPDATPVEQRRRGAGHLVGSDGRPLADPSAANAFEPDSNLNFEKWGEYWRKVHGERFIYHDGVDQANLLKLLRYDQIHRFAPGPTDTSSPPYFPPLDEEGRLFPTIVGHVEHYQRPRWDGAAYLTFATIDDVGAVLATERVRSKIAPEDFAMFRDVAPLLARQFVVKTSGLGGDPVSLVRLHVRQPDQDRAEFQRRWLGNHSNVVLRVDSETNLIRRYVQLHNVGPTSEGRSFYHPETSLIDGVSLFGFGSVNDVEAFLASSAWREIVEDERSFALSDRAEYWTAINVTILNRIAEDVCTTQ